jgi:predicted phosphodiesterase
MTKLLVTGDIHGDFSSLNTLINKKNPDITIQCGDNAYYWLDNDNTGKIKPQGSKVYLIPGNHENWDRFEISIGRRGEYPVEIEKDIFYCPIGSVLKIMDLQFMFIGGALSHDRKFRTKGIDWFSQEVLNDDDLSFCKRKQHNEIDGIFSHTCPLYFTGELRARGLFNKSIEDPTCQILNRVHDYYNPDIWYFGHWHYNLEWRYKKTFWSCLHMSPESHWWTYYSIE